MSFVGQEKPELDELAHFGVKGMRWGVRRGLTTAQDRKNLESRKVIDKMTRQRDVALIKSANPFSSSEKRKEMRALGKQIQTDIKNSPHLAPSIRMTAGEKVAVTLLGGPAGLGGVLINEAFARGVERRQAAMRK